MANQTITERAGFEAGIRNANARIMRLEGQLEDTSDYSELSYIRWRIRQEQYRIEQFTRMLSALDRRAS